MFAKLANLLSRKSSPLKIIIRKGNQVQIISASAGENLMDATNKIVNSKTNIYGLCNKQLACTTCSVHIKNLQSLLPRPKQQQIDILMGLEHFRENQTRMACQIYLTAEMNNLEVEIPDSKIGII